MDFNCMVKVEAVRVRSLEDEVMICAGIVEEGGWGWLLESRHVTASGENEKRD